MNADCNAMKTAMEKLLGYEVLVVETAGGWHIYGAPDGEADDWRRPLGHGRTEAEAMANALALTEEVAADFAEVL